MNRQEQINLLRAGVAAWNEWYLETHEYADLRDADLRDANLSDANLIGAYLSDADLRGADLRGADLIGANLRRANLSDANLIGANLGDANLRDANLSDANLRRADLSDADLSDADLRDADLRDADLRDANLRDANLRRADLRRADLRRANLIGAYLSDADLRGANGLLDPIEYLIKNGEKHEYGLVFFKSFDENYTPTEKWKIEPGAILQETVNFDRSTECGSGVNVAPLFWCKQNCSNAIWRVLIKWEWMGGVCVPYNTDGKIRASKVQLLEKI